MSPHRSISKRFSPTVVTVASVMLVTGCSLTQVPSEAFQEDKPIDVMTIDATYFSFASAQQLVDASDVIVKGSIVGSRYEASYPLPPSTDDYRLSPQAGMTAEQLAQLEPTPITVYTVAIDEVIAGEQPGRQVEVMQVGGILEGVKYESTNPILEGVGGSELVLVLSEQPNGYYDLPNPDQGAYKVDTGETIVPLSDSNELGVDSIPELEQLAQASTGKRA